MEIKLDDLTSPIVHELLAEHLANMYAVSPPESVHALDLDGLRRPEITFWSVWEGNELIGCGALKELDRVHGEIKSMRTRAPHRRKGIARAMLTHIIAEARRRQYERLSLETGTEDEFDAARRLYESAGFIYCPPFLGYMEDPNSAFMTLELK